MFRAAAIPLFVLAFSAPARAEEGGDLPVLLHRLEKQADGLEQLKKHASYTLRGQYEELDSDGKPSHTKAMVARIIATGTDEPGYELARYIDDGVDRTAEAKQKAAERKKSSKAKAGDKKKDFHLPFLASEQGRYVFGIAEREEHRVRVTFVPKVPAEDAYKGSAWVDLDAGEVLTMGFSFSKNPSFVDHVDVTVRFDNPTSLGRAPSNISFDARGGFLFVHKHYRGNASLEDAKVTL